MTKHTIDLDKLGANDLYAHYCQSADFDGSYKTFKGLVRTGRIETEASNETV